MFKIEIRTRNHLDNEENNDSQPIEHVVNCGCCKSSAEFVTITHLSQTHDRIGDLFLNKNATMRVCNVQIKKLT